MNKKVFLLTPIIFSLWSLASCKTNENEFIVTFNSQSGSKVESQVVEAGKLVIEPKAPTRSGYVFKEWTTDVAGQNKYNFNSAVNNSFELFAQWTDKYHVVSFDSDGGTIVPSEKVQENNFVIEPQAPTKEGYTFIEWQYFDGEKYSKYDFATPVTSSFTLKAKYDNNVFEVIANTESEEKGTVSGSDKYKFNQLASVVATPKDGYSFLAWYKDDETTILSRNSNYSFIVKNDTKVLAKFYANEYNIKYHNVTDSEHHNPSTYTIESKTLSLSAAIREKHIFKGWYSDSELTKPVTEIKAGSTGDVDLYAKWEQTDNPIVVFDTLCVTDECYDPVEVINEDGTITYEAKFKYSPVWATFDGWYYDLDGVEYKFIFKGESVETPTKISSSMYVYAKYSNVSTSGTSGLTYSLNSTGGYTVSAINSIRDKQVIIPAVVAQGTYYVLINEIGSMFNCYKLTEVVIPPTVEIIGSHAFDSCEKLTTVTFTDIENSKLAYINAFAFRYCSTYSITLPESVILIRADAFNCVHNLRSINLPKNVNLIYGAFLCCNNLVDIKIPDDCVSYTNTIDNIRYPHAIFEISDVSGEYNLFHQSDAATIPDKVVKLCDKSFWSLPITSLTLPDSIREIGENVFRDCRSLKTVNISATSNLTRINKEAFKNATINTIRIPSKVTIIGANAFVQTSLSSVYVDSPTIANFTDNESKVFINNVYVKKDIALDSNSYLITAGYKKGATVDEYTLYSK